MYILRESEWKKKGTYDFNHGRDVYLRMRDDLWPDHDRQYTLHARLFSANQNQLLVWTITDYRGVTKKLFLNKGVRI